MLKKDVGYETCSSISSQKLVEMDGTVGHTKVSWNNAVISGFSTCLITFSHCWTIMVRCHHRTIAVIIFSSYQKAARKQTSDWSIHGSTRSHLVFTPSSMDYPHMDSLVHHRSWSHGKMCQNPSPTSHSAWDKWRTSPPESSWWNGSVMANHKMKWVIYNQSKIRRDDQ